MLYLFIISWAVNRMCVVDYIYRLYYRKQRYLYTLSSCNVRYFNGRLQFKLKEKKKIIFVMSMHSVTARYRGERGLYTSGGGGIHSRGGGSRRMHCCRNRVRCVDRRVPLLFDLTHRKHDSCWFIIVIIIFF